METIGTVESLWRYPVKSMGGEQLKEAYLSFAGIYGDRLYAFRSETRPKGFPYLTGREQAQMILFRPRFRHPDKAAMPPNLAEARDIEPGLNPVFGDADDLAVEVQTPAGEVLAIDDEKLRRDLAKKREDPTVTLMRSDRAMTDCRPVSLFSIQTAHQLGAELAMDLDKRRFRANVYLDLAGSCGFAEDRLVGRTVRIGSRTLLSILERDPRCAMITFDPETGARNTDILGMVTEAHEGRAGVYAAVLVEGTVRIGDEVAVLD